MIIELGHLRRLGIVTSALHKVIVCIFSAPLAVIGDKNVHLPDTERAVGEAIKESGIPRDQIFLTTKLRYISGFYRDDKTLQLSLLISWLHQHIVVQSFEESLRALDVEYINLTEGSTSLPRNPDGTIKVREYINFNETWVELEKHLETGKVRATIGVSNFSIKTLEEPLTTARITPAVNQVELHPYVLQAYTPSGWDSARNDPLIIELAKKHNATPNQVTLAWHLARQTVIVVKSDKIERQRENIT
ncbi:hypothetical protein H0H81_011450, partial [Sphagnurus paluster]